MAKGPQFVEQRPARFLNSDRNLPKQGAHEFRSVCGGLTLVSDRCGGVTIRWASTASTTWRTLLALAVTRASTRSHSAVRPTVARWWSRPSHGSTTSMFKALGELVDKFNGQNRGVRPRRGTRARRRPGRPPVMPGRSPVTAPTPRTLSRSTSGPTGFLGAVTTNTDTYRCPTTETRCSTTVGYRRCSCPKMLRVLAPRFAGGVLLASQGTHRRRTNRVPVGAVGRGSSGRHGWLCRGDAGVRSPCPTSASRWGCSRSPGARSAFATSGCLWARPDAHRTATEAPRNSGYPRSPSGERISPALGV